MESVASGPKTMHALFPRSEIIDPGSTSFTRRLGGLAISRAGQRIRLNVKIRINQMSIIVECQIISVGYVRMPFHQIDDDGTKESVILDNGNSPAYPDILTSCRNFRGGNFCTVLIIKPKQSLLNIFIIANRINCQAQSRRSSCPGPFGTPFMTTKAPPKRVHITPSNNYRGRFDAH